MAYATLKDLLKGICDAVRAKKGTTGEINHQDIPSEIESIATGADVSGVTATAGDVLSPKVFVDANGEEKSGTMVNNGTYNITLNTSTTSAKIPAGKHSGAGTASIITQTKICTPSTSVQYIYPDSGKVLSRVTVYEAPDYAHINNSMDVSVSYETSGSYITKITIDGIGTENLLGFHLFSMDNYSPSSSPSSCYALVSLFVDLYNYNSYGRQWSNQILFDKYDNEISMGAGWFNITSVTSSSVVLETYAANRIVSYTTSNWMVTPIYSK